jgi:hypothetical protein
MEMMAIPTTRDESRMVVEEIEHAASQLDAAVLAKLIKRLSEYLFVRTSDPRTSHETGLLFRINNGVSDSDWQTYKSLNRKRKAATISVAELKGLTKLSDRIELAHAERLNALLELSQLRGVSVNKLMKEFGIRKRRNG